MIRFLQHPKRNAVAALLVMCVLIPAMVFVRQGRFCDTRIGAVGHPYWQFVNGKVYLVVCDERTFQATYGRTASGWEATYVSSKGVTNTGPLEFHWWGWWRRRLTSTPVLGAGISG